MKTKFQLLALAILLVFASCNSEKKEDNDSENKDQTQNDSTDHNNNSDSTNTSGNNEEEDTETASDFNAFLKKFDNLSGKAKLLTPSDLSKAGKSLNEETIKTFFTASESGKKIKPFGQISKNAVLSVADNKFMITGYSANGKPVKSIQLPKGFRKAYLFSSGKIVVAEASKMTTYKTAANGNISMSVEKAPIFDKVVRNFHARVMPFSIYEKDMKTANLKSLKVIKPLIVAKYFDKSHQLKKSGNTFKYTKNYYYYSKAVNSKNYVAVITLDNNDGSKAFDLTLRTFTHSGSPISELTVGMFDGNSASKYCDIESDLSIKVRGMVKDNEYYIGPNGKIKKL